MKTQTTVCICRLILLKFKVFLPEYDLLHSNSYHNCWLTVYVCFTLAELAFRVHEKKFYPHAGWNRHVVTRDFFFIIQSTAASRKLLLLAQLSYQRSKINIMIFSIITCILSRPSASPSNIGCICPECRAGICCRWMSQIIRAALSNPKIVHWKHTHR